MRILALVTDAYGSRGGIAKFNRDLLDALCAQEGVSEVVALPRLVREDVGPMPALLRFRDRCARGKLHFMAGVLRESVGRRFDVVVCGHLYLLPAALLAARLTGGKLVLVIHGIDAWTPPPRWLARRLVRRTDEVVSVSEFTKRRFLEWASVSADRVHVIPNCVDVSRYGMGPKRADLLERYGLEGRTVLLTVGRLAGVERYKGFDEVMGILPVLSRTVPNVTYLIAGEGSDRERLESVAVQHGVGDRVVFAGYVREEEKADHYRLADAYVMPSRGEGFGIVYLEAMACGIPVVASSADASQEAVLGGSLGEVVDPHDREAMSAAVLRALAKPRVVPAGLDYFSIARFRERWCGLISNIMPSTRVAVSDPNA